MCKKLEKFWSSLDRTILVNKRELVLGIAAAWLGANLFQVAVGCCAVVLVLEFFLI